MTDIARSHFRDGKPRPYAATATFQDIVFACGQVPTLADGSVAPTIAGQVHAAINVLESVLKDAGSGLDRILKLTVFLADLDEFEEYNQAYLQRLTGVPLPPRTTVEVTRFRGGKRIEIDAIAAKLPRAI